MPKRLEVKQGDQYGKLTVLSEAESHRKPSGQISRRFVCECVCGSRKSYALSSLRQGKTKTCGCIKTATTHGMSNTREYQTWESMITRCSSPNHRNFRHYGGRGIKVCDRWRNSFEAFYQDMGPRPEKHSIDRIDNDGNYEPSNCRWTTQSEQNFNRRCRYKWVVNGVPFDKLTIAEESLGITVPALHRMCVGYKDNKGNFTPPLENCHREKVL